MYSRKKIYVIFHALLVCQERKIECFYSFILIKKLKQKNQKKTIEFCRFFIFILYSVCVCVSMLDQEIENKNKTDKTRKKNQ